MLANADNMPKGLTKAPTTETTMQTLGAARCLSLLTIVSETLTECQAGAGEQESSRIAEWGAGSPFRRTF